MLSKLDNRVTGVLIYVIIVLAIHSFSMSPSGVEDINITEPKKLHSIDLTSMHLKEAIKNFIEYRNEAIQYETENKNYDLRNDYIYEDLFKELVLQYESYFDDIKDDEEFKEI